MIYDAAKPTTGYLASMDEAVIFANTIAKKYGWHTYAELDPEGFPCIRYSRPGERYTPAYCYGPRDFNFQNEGL